MTREEGIHKLKIVKKTECIGCSHRDNGEYCEKVCGIPEALGMAIDALEAQTEMEEHLESAYAHGYTEAEAQFHEMRQWIPCSVRLPKKGDWYLGVFKENDTGWISPIPQVCRYVGDDTGETTKDGWLLRNVDKNTFGFAYYRKLECVAWAELPELYQEEQE